MMIEGSIVTILLFCWLFLRAARESEEKQALVELAAARGVELSEERAARAVSAGRGDALRERILSEGPPTARSSAWSVPSACAPATPRPSKRPRLGGTARAAVLDGALLLHPAEAARLQRVLAGGRLRLLRGSTA